MSYTWISLLVSLGLFIGMMSLFGLGRRLGLSCSTKDDGKGSGSLETAVFGLLGLLLAFTFSGAASRFEDRRHVIAEEANAIGTAYLRLDLLPQSAQTEIKPLVVQYTDMRLSV